VRPMPWEGFFCRRQHEVRWVARLWRNAATDGTEQRQRAPSYSGGTTNATSLMARLFSRSIRCGSIRHPHQTLPQTAGISAAFPWLLACEARPSMVTHRARC
jgi:hypothetical protein